MEDRLGRRHERNNNNRPRPGLAPVPAERRTTPYEIVATFSVTPNGSTDSADYTSNTLFLTVANVAPTADFPAELTVGEGGEVPIGFTNPVDPSPEDKATLRYSLALTPDGLADSYAGASEVSSQTFSFPEGGTDQTVYGRIFDQDNGFTTYSAVVHINNINPTATFATEQASYPENSPAVVQFINPDDPSRQDTAAGFHYSIALNSSDLADTYEGALDGPSKSFVFPDHGQYIVYGRIFDRKDGFSEYSYEVQVDDVAPTATISGISGPYNEGSPISLTGSATDPSPLDMANGFTFTWSVTRNNALYVTGTGSEIHFTPDDDGQYIIDFKASEANGMYATTYATIDVHNVAPTSTISGGPSDDRAAEGALIHLTGTATDPGSIDAESLTFTWSVTKNNDPYQSGSGSDIQFTPDDNGLFVVTLQATDKDGEIGTVSRTITILDVAPIASILGTPAGNVTSEGSTIQLSSSVTDVSGPDEDHGFLYSWLVTKNNQFYATGTNATFDLIPNDDGTYEVTLQAIDKDGGISLPASQIITVKNVNPTPTIVRDPEGTSAVEGQTIALSASVSDPGLIDQAAGFLYEWVVIKDNVTYGSSTKGGIDLIPSDNGTYVVQLTTTDANGGKGSTSRTFTVDNVAPTLTAPSDQNAEEGTLTAFQLGSFSDPGSFDNPWTVEVDWGDGTPHTMLTTNAQGSLGTRSHSYDDNGSYSVTVRVSDKDRLASQLNFTVVVANVNPKATILDSSTTGPEGTPILLGSSFFDPSNADSVALIEHNWTVTKNGRFYGSGQAADFTFTPDDNGTYVVQLFVKDKDEGTSDVVERTITIDNVAPTANLDPVGPVSVGIPVTLNLSGATDVSVADRDAGLRYSFALNAADLADYAHARSDPSATFSFDASGTYTVYGRVIDKDGGRTDYTTTVTVQDAISAVLRDDPLNPGKTALFVSGSSSKNSIVVTEGGGDSYSVIIDGTNFNVGIPESRIVVLGQEGDDDITISGSINVPVWAYGGPGDDRISGGASNDVILGGDGDDLLIGDQGRDLLIGGNGADRIIGNADDDILIAGTTSYDATDVALEAITSEWGSTRSYAERIANLRGPNTSPRNNGAYFLIVDGTNRTVFDDGTADKLTGSAGDDWFLFNDDGDGDSRTRDRAVDMHSWEYEDDLDFINKTI